MTNKRANFQKSENKDMRNPYSTLYMGYTERLFLRPYQKHDARDYAELANNERVQARDFGVILPFTQHHATKKINHFIDLWNKGNCYAFTLRHEESNQMIGGASLVVYHHHQLGELGYWLGEPYWGQGYATEAAASIIQFGFEEIGVEKIASQTIINNHESANVLQKVGMEREGTLKKHWIKEGKRVDLVQFGIVRGG